MLCYLKGLYNIQKLNKGLNIYQIFWAEFSDLHKTAAPGTFQTQNTNPHNAVIERF